MDAVLENIANSLYNGTLPYEWARLAPDTRKNLAGWMEHFERRIEQYTSWVLISLEVDAIITILNCTNLYIIFRVVATSQSSCGYQVCTVQKHIWQHLYKWHVAKIIGLWIVRSCTQLFRTMLRQNK